MYHRRRPFLGLTDAQVIAAVAVKHETPEWDPGAPAELMDLAKSCWALEPASRPSFRDIIDTLARLGHIQEP